MPVAEEATPCGEHRIRGLPLGKLHSLAVLYKNSLDFHSRVARQPLQIAACASPAEQRHHYIFVSPPNSVLADLPKKGID
jgi:hypothetical protein